MIVIIREKLNTCDFRTDEKWRMGKLYVNGAFFCDTLENPDKLIPCGMYLYKVNMSPKFKRTLPLLYNRSEVPDTRGIRIHAGNTVADTSGCILVGERINGKGLANNSRSYESILLRIMIEEHHTFIITEDCRL